MKRPLVLAALLSLSYAAIFAQANKSDAPRLAGYSHTIGNGTTLDYTYSYDEYGFPATVACSDGSTLTYTYTWREPGKVWSAKKVMKTAADGNRSIAEDVTRTFHPNGSLATSKSVIGGNEYDLRYDAEGHLIYDLTRTMLQDGTMVDDSKQSFYFPFIDKWLAGYEQGNSKNLYFEGANENEYILEVWRPYQADNGEGKSYLAERRFYYCRYTGGNETVSYRYQPDGTLTYASGTRLELERGEGGSYIETTHRLSYRDNTESWTFNNRKEYSPNWLDPWVYKAGETRYIKNYAWDGEEYFYLSAEDITYSWVNERVAKEFNDAVSSTSYKYFDPESGRNKEWLYGDTAYYNEKTGEFFLLEELNDQSGYWTMETTYNSTFQPVRTIRYQKGKYMDCISDVEIQGADGWGKCSGEMQINNELVVFDQTGRVVEIKDLTKDGKTAYKYSYTDTGYSLSAYTNNSSQSYVNQVLDVTIDGQKTTIIASYLKSDGSFDYYGYKKVYDYDKLVCVNYKYNQGTGEWTESSKSTMYREEVLPDGKRLLVRSSKNYETGEIELYSKTIYISDGAYLYNEEYQWDAENGEWVGWRKYETINLPKPEVEVIYPADPLLNFDEYFTATELPKEKASESGTKNWAWDPSTKAWVDDYISGDVYEQPTPQTLVWTNADRYGSESRTTEFDHQNRATSESYSSTLYPEKNYIKTWSYNPDGTLAGRQTFGDSGNSESYTYRYEQSGSSVSTIEDAPATVTVYTLQGFCILTGAPAEELARLPKGLYIVNGKKLLLD